MQKKIVILGAGISGLTSAYWLYKNGIDFTILESKSEPGGAMESLHDNGFMVDFGPNSGLETTPLISQIVKEVGLSNEMVYANESSDKRYILRDGTLHALPMSPPALIQTKLFSTKAKLRLMAEPFIGKSADGYYQTMAQFVERRLGKEFLDYAIDPFVSGVSAGDPYKLSVKSAFPKLYRLEELYGGLIKGMIKGARERKKRAEKSKQNAKMFSFVSGMQIFPKTISSLFTDKINYSSVVNNISKTENGYNISYTKDNVPCEIECGIILSTIPAYGLSPAIKGLDAQLVQHLDDIFYPTVMVLYLGFDKSQIGQPLDGFGYLIPSKENRNYLGAIWSSTIFPERTNKNNEASFTLFVGGARKMELFEKPVEDIISTAVKEFKKDMKISSGPVYTNYKIWPKAIPQYNIGYVEHENYFETFEKDNPGFFLSGNYRGGIAVGDCVKNSENNYKKILHFIKNN
jgi:oxygen-dependent protoporphyrinogen oxidase